jgi:CTP-dependent riboflavin kinase
LKKNSLKVKLELEGQTYEFEGELDDVITAINKVISKIYPSYNLAKSIMINIDVKDLIEMVKPFLMITEDGDVVFTSMGEKLSIINKIMAVLIAARLMTLSNIRNDDYMSLSELSYIVASSSKSTSSRLSELFSRGYIEKKRGDEGVKYRVSLKGILAFQRKKI